METDELIRVLINAENKRLTGATTAIAELRKLDQSHSDLIDALETLCDSIEGNRVTVCDMNQAHAAIAKAKGQA